MKSIVISAKDEGQTIFKFVKKYLDSAPLSFIEKLFRIKDIKVNKKRVDKNFVIKENDLVEIYISDQQYDEFNKKNGETKINIYPNIIYEDDNILIANKPSGLLVHGDKNEKKYTLSNMVLSYLNDKGEYKYNDSFVPGPAHRIDRNTSGIVIFGKNIKSLQTLEQLFKERNSIHKSYLALVSGHVKEKGVIDKPLFKDEVKSIVKVMPIEKGGKTAITEYVLKEKYQYASLVEATILTGRTHQIRVHFASINHPLLGDSKYGDFALNKKFDKEFKYNYQFLHAYRLRFGKIEGVLSYLTNKEFVCELDEKEKKILSFLRGGAR